jgi:hypothetical protein
MLTLRSLAAFVLALALPAMASEANTGELFRIEPAE